MPPSASLPLRDTQEEDEQDPDGIYGPPFLYDPGDFGISFLLRWQGTILPLVVASPLYWFLKGPQSLSEDEPGWAALETPDSTGFCGVTCRAAVQRWDGGHYRFVPGNDILNELLWSS